MSARKDGEWLLGYFWRNSVLSKAPQYPITNWKGFLTWLDQNRPGLIDYLGNSLNDFDQSALINAMKKAGERGSLGYQQASNDIQKEMVNASGKTFSTISVIGNTAKEIGGDIIDAASIFSKLVIFGVIAVGALYAFQFYKKAKG